MNYAKAVRIGRSLSNLSQAQLSSQSGVERSYLSMIESGARKPSHKTLEKISKGLGIPFHLFTLLGLEPDTPESLDKRDIQRLAEELVLLLLSKRDSVEQEAGFA